VQRDPTMIEDALSGEMATTNAYFDELYIDEVEFADGEEGMVASLSGSLNGESDQDRVFHGDKISFTTVMTFPRLPGRVAFLRPQLETSGQVDESMYHDD
jgi:hypothetical protein